jgi:DNA polymerase-3 subunit alpha
MYLNCHTCYSFKFGALSIKALLNEAVKHGVPKLAVTDINNTSAILDVHRYAVDYAEEFPVQPIAGIDFRNGVQQQFIGIAKNHEGFNELNLFLTKCIYEGEKGLTGREVKIPARAPEFENAWVVYPFASFPPSAAPLQSHELIGVKPADLNRLRFSPWKNHPEKLVILAPVTFRNKVDFNAHRLLRAIDNNIVLSKLAPTEQASPDEVMKPESELCEWFKDFPSLIYNTRKLLDECEPIDFEFGKNKNRKSFTGSTRGDAELLVKLCNDHLEYRYPKKGKAVAERFNHEIKLITELGFAAYFLINWDIVRYAQHRNFFYVGRGSGANSMVAYLLRITDVDPIELDLYFERFINSFRTSPPDFDIDFSWTDRDEITEYIFKRNLTEKTCLLGAYSTFQAASVVRELGKVFGLPKREIDVLQDPRLYPPTHDHLTRLIYQYGRVLDDFPNHLTIHASGILISEKPMTYYTALANPPKGFPLAQFSMLEAEDVGFAKFDILSQRGLGHIKDAVEIIKNNCGKAIDIHDVKRFKKDKNVERHLTEARLMGCFYVESPAMRMLLTKLKAKTYLDLVAASSIIRPGVAQSGMMQEYIRRFHDPRHGKSKAIPQLWELMPDTFGVMVYQEDVIKVAHHFAGLTLGEADLLRRGMNGKYKGRAEFMKIKDTFFANCKAKGYPDDLTAEVWRETESFGGYAFAKGHSASFAVESYQSMFLKAYYPREFMVAVINNHGGFYRTEYYLHEARMAGAEIHAPEINHSQVLTSISGGDLYLGFELIKDLEKSVQETIVSERNSNGEFDSLENFLRRVSIPVEQLRILIRVGAFRFTGKTRQELLWEVHAILGHRKKSTARKELFGVGGKKYALPELFNDPFADARNQIELLGFPLCSPFTLIKPWPAEKNIPQASTWSELVSHVQKHPRPGGEPWSGAVEITGYYVTYKPTSTKKGEPMMFGCFLDRDGIFFDTNHFPEAARRFPFRGAGCYRLVGTVTEEFGFYSLNVLEMHKLDYVMYEEDAETQARSRPDPVIVPPVVAASKEFDYLLVIAPPPHICKEVMEWKKELHRRLDHRAAVTDRPYLALCSFSESEQKESLLLKKISAVAAQHAPLRVALKDFTVFPPHTLSVNVLHREAIIELIDHLQHEMKLPPKNARFVSHPQLPVARGLTSEKLARASAGFCEQKYAASFVARHLLLLKKPAGVKWAKYETVREFGLEGKRPLPVSTHRIKTVTPSFHSETPGEAISE